MADHHGAGSSSWVCPPDPKSLRLSFIPQVRRTFGCIPTRDALQSQPKGRIFVGSRKAVYQRMENKGSGGSTSYQIGNHRDGG
jgi:hypothetical protein